MAADISGIKADVRVIRTLLDQRAGERKILDWGGRIASALVGAIAALLVKRLTP